MDRRYRNFKLATLVSALVWAGLAQAGPVTDQMLAAEAGVDIVLNTPVEEVIVAQGRVAGVVAGGKAWRSKGEQAAVGDEQAKGLAILVLAPLGRAFGSRPFFGELSLTQDLDHDPVKCGTLCRQAVRQGKKRPVGALRGSAEDHKLSIAELGLFGFLFGHNCLHRVAPARCRRFHCPQPGQEARGGR